MSLAYTFCTIMLFVLTVTAAARAEEGLKVFVSIMPQKYFVGEIGKDKLDVEVMVQPGSSPHTYEPKPSQMAALSKSRLYFAIGVTFEKVWLKRIAAANPSLKIVRTEEGIEKIPMISHSHDEGDGHSKHSHGEPDPHIWLSPPLVLTQARNILAALQEVDPRNYDFYESNYRAFASKIMELDCDLRNIFRGKAGMSFLVFHPAWGYFAKAYGLKQVPIETEGKEPKPAQLQGLIRKAKDKGIRVVFLQPQIPSRSAEQAAVELGGQVITVDPLSLDWMKNLKDVAGKFREALK
jgi:zinc transport system substrate-binding protein